MPCPSCGWRGWSHPTDVELQNLPEAFGLDADGEHDDPDPEDYGVCNQCGHCDTADEFADW